jgi:AcrR family transcriptional regulator
LATARDLATAEPPSRTRKLRRGPLTRKQILDASLRLFSEKGFARTSVRDIAQAAGITDAAIYYHFASKRELFEALIEERGFTAAIEGLERAEVTIAPDQAIPGIATRALALMYANRDLMKVLMVEAMAEDPVAAEEYRMLVERWERAQARILKFYADEGSVRTEDIDELAKQIVTTVIGIFADHLMSVSGGNGGDEVPAGLLRHVDVAMRHVVRAITCD